MLYQSSGKILSARWCFLRTLAFIAVEKRRRNVSFGLKMKEIKIGIIGGSGLEDADFFDKTDMKSVETPFGKPSDLLKCGFIGNVPCVVLSRHGRTHAVAPSQVNYRANVWALKQLGCTHILATTACGSLQENIVPGDLVFLDQFIDRTTKRLTTFFDGTTVGAPAGVCHIPMHTPFCPRTRQLLIEAAQELAIRHAPTGTCVCIEGPRFSSRAESHVFRSWGAHVINMTTVPEVCLAKELGLCYASIALPTDYDCWRDGAEAVSVDLVMKTFHENAQKATDVLKLTVKRIGEQDWAEYIRESEKVASTSVMLPPGVTTTHLHLDEAV